MPRKKERIRRKVVVGHDSAGNPVIKWAIGYTIKEVEAQKQALIRDFVSGATSDQSDIVYRCFVQQWYDTRKKGKLSASTKDNYATALNGHIIPYLGDKQLRAISAFDLQNVMNRLDGRGKTIIGDVYSILTNTMKFAYARGYIERNPAVDLEKPKASRKCLRALTDDETAAALHVGATHPHGLLLLLLYYTGMRRGEALGLRWGDVDLEKRIISVNRDIDFSTNDVGGVKTPAAIRKIPIPQVLYDALRSKRGMPTVYVIQAPRTGSFLNQPTYNRWWKQLMIAMLETSPGIERKVIKTEKAIADGKKREVPVYGSMLTAHYFRHNYASFLYDANVDVLTAQKVLGHSDAKTTLSIYTHLQKSREDIGVQQICDAFDKPQKDAPDTINIPV